MITIENLAAFVLGMAVVYMMFRALGVVCFVALLSFALCLSPCPARAQIGVTNWPDSSVPLSVTVSRSTGDVWPSAAAGFGFGLTVCGFGWVLRMSKKVGGYHE